MSSRMQACRAHTRLARHIEVVCARVHARLDHRLAVAAVRPHAAEHQPRGGRHGYKGVGLGDVHAGEDGGGGGAMRGTHLL